MLVSSREFKWLRCNQQFSWDIIVPFQDKGTSPSKQNSQSSSTTFIYKTLIIPSFLDSCFISSTVSEDKRAMLLSAIFEFLEDCSSYNKVSESAQDRDVGEVNPTRAYYNGSCTSKDTEDPSWSTSFKTRRTRKTSSALEALWKTLFVLYLYMIGTLQYQGETRCFGTMPGTTYVHHNKGSHFNIQDIQDAQELLFAYATGEKIPKPKYVKNKVDSESSPKKKTSTTAKGKRLKTSAKAVKPTKKKQPAKTSKAKGLTGSDEGTGSKPRVPDVPTYRSDDEQISWKYSDKEDYDEVGLNDDDDDNDDDEDNDDDDDNDDDEDNDDDDDDADNQDDHDQDDVNEQTDLDNDGDD
ncbi:hypothetical protein Tco_0575076 [Tanacetum coccineum]